MIKIGLTRRLEPMDRVRELGDASVPFNFDVHALIFSLLRRRTGDCPAPGVRRSARQSLVNQRRESPRDAG